MWRVSRQLPEKSKDSNKKKDGSQAKTSTLKATELKRLAIG